MLDGWQVRQRGPGWGLRKTKENGVDGMSGRLLCITRRKSPHVVREVAGWWQASSSSAGRAIRWSLAVGLHWEGLLGGLGRARARLVVGDGTA